jgi:membrane protein DedA with SNARE-associated domain
MGLLNFFLEIIQYFGYGGIVFLMAVESSFLPLPSEVIIPPAALLALKGEMNIFLIIIAGTVGSVIGAIVNYALSYYLGRAIVFGVADSKFGKLILLNSKKIEKAENFFLRYGNVSTFIGRLLPVVRHLISIPAGFSKMNFKKFVLFTALGAFIWVLALAALGYYLGKYAEVIVKFYKEISYLLIILLIIYGMYRWLKKKKVKRIANI